MDLEKIINSKSNTKDKDYFKFYIEKEYRHIKKLHSKLKKSLY